MIHKLRRSAIVSRVTNNRWKEAHIQRALRLLHGHTYVEIGVRAGECFNQIVAPRKIGVDPAPRGFGSTLAAGELFFRMTSDDFFATHAEKLFRTQRVDVALVDGLHEFEQALRDILQLEQVMSPGGIIFVHDMNPPTRKHAEMLDGSAWCGDVWKVAYYVRTYRSDLTLFTLNCDWGLGVITGFGSACGSALPTAEILQRCKRIDYALLNEQRNHLLRLRSAWYSSVFFRFLHKQMWG